MSFIPTHIVVPRRASDKAGADGAGSGRRSSTAVFTGSDLSEAEKVELMEKSEAILRKSDTPDRVSARDGENMRGTQPALCHV